jgi:hypothetical protein
MIHTFALRDKARLLLKRQHQPVTLGGYLRANAIRHSIFAAIFWLIIAVSWLSGYHAAALIVGGFWTGRLMRDIQWYQRLAAEWELTREIIDWKKVSALVQAEHPVMHS